MKFSECRISYNFGIQEDEYEMRTPLEELLYPTAMIVNRTKAACE